MNLLISSNPFKFKFIFYFNLNVQGSSPCSGDITFANLNTGAFSIKIVLLCEGYETFWRLVVLTLIITQLSIDGADLFSVICFSISADLRPKGRGRPQRILLGNWPDEHVRQVIWKKNLKKILIINLKIYLLIFQVIRAVVFRDGTIPSYNHAAAANFSSPQSAVPRPGPSTSPR